MNQEITKTSLTSWTKYPKGPIAGYNDIQARSSVFIGKQLLHNYSGTQLRQAYIMTHVNASTLFKSTGTDLWMVVTLDKTKGTGEMLSDFGILTSENIVAIDLGAGHGLQSTSLANLGFRVYAVDFSQQLLDELNLYRENRSIKFIQQDIL
ncbi:MAG: methyltransferase domain-containing protein [Chryseolinea sp.]